MEWLACSRQQTATIIINNAKKGKESNNNSKKKLFSITFHFKCLCVGVLNGCSVFSVYLNRIQNYVLFMCRQHCQTSAWDFSFFFASTIKRFQSSLKSSLCVCDRLPLSLFQIINARNEIKAKHKKTRDEEEGEIVIVIHFISLIIFGFICDVKQKKCFCNLYNSYFGNSSRKTSEQQRNNNIIYIVLLFFLCYLLS